MTQPDAAATPEPVSTAAVLAAAAVGGAAVMAVELSAVRLVAPWFGSSLAVWTNVLGVVLTALALGYLLGARLARGRRPVRALALLFALSSGLVASTPWLADPICGAFLPDRVALSEAGALIVNGSLAVSLALFLPSATLLGAIGPLSVEAVQRRRGGHAGTAGGQVLCVSTLGSLAGTFGTSHLLLPELGVAGTFLAAGVTLAGLGAVLALGTRRRAEAALALLLGAAALVELLRDVDPTASADPDRTVLAERDSAYQRVRVVELSDGSRRLEVNERTDSFQSVWFPEPGLLPPGFYYNDFALPAWWQAAQDGAPPGSWRVAILGLGGGTAWRVLDGALPEDTALSGLGIEIDPTVVALSRAYLDLPAPGAALDVRAGLDARVGLRASEGGFDQVVLDTYANQVEIPAHLATVEFLREVRDALRPGGWLTVNVGAFGLDDPLLEAIATSAATAFESPLLALQVPFSRNVTLVARRDGALPELDAGGVGEPAIDALLAPRALPGAARRIEPLRNGASSGRGLLTDDRSPTERLQRQAIARARERDLPAAASGRAWIERFDPGGDNVLERARSASREAEFAGDLEAARAIAMAGLESDPEDLELLLRMGATALSLSRPDAAQAPLDALAAALETASGMAPETLQWWNERLATNRDWLDTQLEGRRARDAASDRAVRTLRLSSVGIGLTALLLVALPRRR